MRSPAALLWTLVLAALLASPAAGQAAPFAPILTDPAGDQAVVPGAVVVTPPPMDNADIVAASGGGDAVAVSLKVDFAAAPTASQVLTVAFAVTKGPTSLPGSTASGEAFAVTVQGTTVNGVADGNATVAGSSVTLTMPLAGLGAVGGDRLSNLTFAVTDVHPGSAPAPVTQDDTSAADQAPDAGAVAFTLPRPPVTPGIDLAVNGGTIRQRQLCGTALCATAETTSFTGATVAARDPNATVTFQVAVKNTGSDADTFNLGLAGTPGSAQAALAETSLVLAPGATGTTEMEVELSGASGKLALTVQATSTRGATAQAQATIDIQPPAAPPADVRTPVPEALGFLTPLAEGMGLDGPLGEFAELALLAFFLLVAVVAVFLAMSLTRGSWVKLSVEPRRAVVAPGETAEFRVYMQPRRKREILARGVLHGAGGSWRTAWQMGRGEQVAPERPLDVPLSAPVAGIVRVQVPADAADHDKETLEFDVTPVDEKGNEHPAHKARAKVTVEAALPGEYGGTRDIQLDEVRHDPANPRVGATVTTHVRVRNHGASSAMLRVVLLLDGHPASDARVAVPGRGSATTQLPWKAGAGRNQVKVQIFLA